MKKQITKLPKSKIEIEFEIPVEEWEEFLNEAAKELSNSLRVQGFRPGNAPRNIVEREIGSGKVLERGVEMAVRKTYINTIVDDKIEVIGNPKITVLKSAPGNPLVFKAEVAVLPEIELADYIKIASEKKPKKEDEIIVEEKEISQSLEWLKKSRAKYVTVLRGAKNNDRLEIDFAASINGEKISAQGARLPDGQGPSSGGDKGESKNYPLVLGQSKFIKGFDENLVGMKEGEEKEFSLVFPEDYHQKDLAGKLADFKVKVNLVQEQELPELNDQFAQSLGNFDNLDKLKQNIKDGIKREKIEKEKQDWRQEVISKVADKSKMEIPELLIEQEIEKMISEMKDNIEGFGLPWGKYLDELKKKEDDFKKDMRPQAEKRVRAALIVREIGKKEKIEVSPAEIEEEAKKFLQHHRTIEGVRSQVDTGQLKEYTYGVIKNEKVFKRLEEVANAK